MNRQGQALVEVAVFVVVTLGLIISFLGFTKYFLVRQKLLCGLREAMVMYSSGHFEMPEVEQRVKEYLKTGSPQLVAERVTLTLQRPSSVTDRMIDVDQLTLRYNNLEETCFIKHANNYGPSIPKLWGPPVRP